MPCPYIQSVIIIEYNQYTVNMVRHDDKCVLYNVMKMVSYF